DVVELLSAIRRERVQHLALRQRPRRPLDRPAAPHGVELGRVRDVERDLVPARGLRSQLFLADRADTGIRQRLGDGGVHEATSTASSTSPAASAASGSRVPPAASASAPAQPSADDGTSAMTQPILARRSARASASTSRTASPPKRSGTVGRPSVTATTSGTAFGLFTSSPRNSNRARRSASASGVCPLSGISSRRRFARAQLGVGGNTTVPSGIPPLKATSDTLSPRRVASWSSSKTMPLTFSTIRSACTDQLLSTTKHTLYGDRCSRTRRRRSSGRTWNGFGADRTAAARRVASTARSRSARPARRCRLYLPRRRPTNDRAREPVAAMPSREDQRGVDLHRLDGGDGVGPRPELRPYLVPPAAFFGVTS